MATKKSKQKKETEKFSLAMEEYEGLQPLPASFKRPKPKKRYTAAEKELIKAARDLLEHLQKLKQQEQQSA